LQAEPEDGAAKKKEEDKDIIGLDSSTRWGTVFDPDEAHQRLLYLATQDDIAEGPKLHMSMLRRCPSIKMHTNLLDGTVYVFAPWVVDLLQEGEAGAKFGSIKEELMPFLVRHQHRSNNKRLPKAATEARMEHLQVHNMTTTLPAMTTTQVEFAQDLVQCYCFVPNTGVDGTPIFCMKVSSVPSYIELNKEISHRRIHAPGQLWKAPEQQPRDRKKFDGDSLIGEGSTFGEKTTVKKSVLGTRCEVGDAVKIASCVIMNDVKIGDGAKLDGCVLCSGAEVPAGLHLTTCRVGYNFKVPLDFGNCKNETLCEEEEFELDEDSD